MNPLTRKHLQENNATGQSLLSASKHRELPDKGKDTVEKPFPSKPVYHKKHVSSTSHALDIKEKYASYTPQKHDSATLNKESSRLPAGEAQMSRVIQEKQLLLQKKLWKVEDALRKKNQHDNVGANINSNLKREDKYFEKQEMVYADTKSKQGIKVNEKEQLTEIQKNPKHKFRQDTVTKRPEPQDHKGGNGHAGKIKSTKKEEGRATYDYNEPTQRSQEAIDLLAVGNINAAKRSAHEELPQVSSNPSGKPELTESEVKNLQLIPCHICHRSFLHNRVEKHIQICEKVSKSKHPVFDSYANRTKGSAAAEFWKTHTRSRTPEVLRKKKQR